MKDNVETVKDLFSKGYINCKEDEIIFRKPKNYDYRSSIESKECYWDWQLEIRLVILVKVGV